LACALTHHLLDDLLPLLFAEPQLLERLIEARAGIRELEVLAVVVDVADIRQRKDGFTAIAFTASDGGNRAGRCDGGLRGIADAMFLDSIDHRIPTHRGPAPVMLELYLSLRRSPLHRLLIVDRTF